MDVVGQHVSLDVKTQLFFPILCPSTMDTYCIHRHPSSPSQSSHPASWRIPAGSLTCEYCERKEREARRRGRGSWRWGGGEGRQQIHHGNFPLHPPHNTNTPVHTHTHTHSSQQCEKSMIARLWRNLNSYFIKALTQALIQGKTLCNSQYVNIYRVYRVGGWPRGSITKTRHNGSLTAHILILTCWF